MKEQLCSEEYYLVVAEAGQITNAPVFLRLQIIPTRKAIEGSNPRLAYFESFSSPAF